MGAARHSDAKELSSMMAVFMVGRSQACVAGNGGRVGMLSRFDRSTTAMQTGKALWQHRAEFDNNFSLGESVQQRDVEGKRKQTVRSRRNVLQPGRAMPWLWMGK